VVTLGDINRSLWKSSGGVEPCNSSHVHDDFMNYESMYLVTMVIMTCLNEECVNVNELLRFEPLTMVKSIFLCAMAVGCGHNTCATEPGMKTARMVERRGRLVWGAL